MECLILFVAAGGSSDRELRVVEEGYFVGEE